MLISCNKLKQFIKNSENINWETIWNTFTIRTAEVEAIEKKGYDLSGVVVAKIISCENHPTKEQYHVLRVTDGTEECDVLCGAPNVRTGMTVAWIKVGGTIKDFTISEKKIAGVLSQGMLCAVDELGIGTDHAGILELPDSFPLGTDIKKLLPIEDIIVEIDNKSLTNRPDLWGHYGIAREIAAITGEELLPLQLLEIENNKSDLDIKINNNDLCMRYIGVTVDEIKNNKTPIDMQIFLHYTGMRSISLLVDLTNYMMLELGQPMHAFDKRVVKNIEVGLANNKDKFTTLDQEERTLSDEMLMIKNGNEYFAIAGVMGGLDSEILDDTTSVFFESATFDAGSVRKTATKLGLRTEASARYEKSLDPNLAMISMKRILYFLKKENPNMIISSNLTDVYANVLSEKEIVLSKELLTIYLSFEMDSDQVKKILNSLDFKVVENNDSYVVTIPTYRATKDISLDCDIIEEIARIYGYENFEKKPLVMDLSFEEYETIWNEEYKIKHYLATKFNYNEVHSYLWFEQAMLNKLELVKENVSLAENKENRILRDDLFLSLLPIVKKNLKSLERVNIMEICSVILDGIDKRHIVAMLASDIEVAESSYYEMKEIIINLIQTYKKAKVELRDYNGFNYYDESYSKDIFVKNQKIGSLVVLKPKYASYVGKKKFVVGLEIDLTSYLSISKERINLLDASKYQTVELDYTLIDYNRQKYEIIESILASFEHEIINSYKLIDNYKSEDMDKYTIRYIVGSKNHTLDGKELNEFKQKFISYIKEKGLDILV